MEKQDGPKYEDAENLSIKKPPRAPMTTWSSRTVGSIKN